MNCKEILNEQDIQDILTTNHFDDNCYKQLFEIPLHIIKKIESAFNIKFPSNKINATFIKNDTPSHIDYTKNKESFDNTFLIYLTTNGGKLIINDLKYDILKGHGFIIPSGCAHETINAGPRLMLGPINEYLNDVGGGLTLHNTIN